MNNIPLHNHTELYEVQNPRSRALPPVIEKEKKKSTQPLNHNPIKIMWI